MNVTTITMPVDAAKAKLKAFRSNTHRDAEQMYAEAAKAYEALAEGTPLISLSAAFRTAGFYDNMRPRLAIARADRREVRFTWRAMETTAEFFCGTPVRRAGPTLTRTVDLGRRHDREALPPPNRETTIRSYALVPMVPADVRPPTGQLKDWFTLWEVERWYDRPKHMEAPVDPMLLKHIGGDLYAVLAQWGLTAVERLILEGAARS